MAHIRELHHKRKPYILRWIENGRDVQRSFATRTEAEEAKVDVERQLRKAKRTRGIHNAPETVQQVVDDMLSVTRLKPRSMQTLRQILDQHIIPRFGNARIAAVRRADVQRFVLELADSGLSRSRVSNIRNSLSRVFRHAIEQELIDTNPCTGVKALGKESEERIRVLTSEQVEAIAAEIPWPFGLLVRFTAQTGLRAGEVSGLRVKDLDLLHRRVYVRQTAQHVHGRWVFDAPKSSAGRRHVPLTAAMARELEAFLSEPRPVRHGQDLRLVFPGVTQGTGAPDYGRPLGHDSWYVTHYRTAQARAGLLGVLRETGNGTWESTCLAPDEIDGELEPFHEIEHFTRDAAARHLAVHSKGGFTFHDLRHSAASWWIKSGISIFKVSRWLGHSTTTLTDRVYSHLIPNDDDAAEMERLESTLASSASR